MTTSNRQKIKSFGKRSGLKVYPVSIGAMRLQDIEAAKPVIRQAIDAGMIYIDTCIGYENSESSVAGALRDGYRSKAILSTKWSPWNKHLTGPDLPTAEDTYSRILESMKNLDVEYLDFYQIWNIDTPQHYEQVIAKGGMLDGIKRAMAEGLVGHTGFTTHDTPENISKYIDDADWCETILFTYNLLNQTYKHVLAKAHQKGIATVVMNPTGGGAFAEDSPILKKAVQDAIGTDDVVEAAHRYLHSDENVDTIISGIMKPSDITSAIDNFSKPLLSHEQVKDLEDAMAKLSSENQHFCSNCKYCMPCEQGINIPAIMNTIYQDRFLKTPKIAEHMYHWAFHKDNGEPSQEISKCTKCGACESKCTQKIGIIEELERLAKKFPRPPKTT